MVHENERPQHAPQPVGQDSLHLKARGKGSGASVNDEVEHGGLNGAE
jgi:hypothetical protein